MALIRFRTESESEARPAQPLPSRGLVSFTASGDDDVGSLFFSTKDQDRIMDRVDKRVAELRADMKSSAKLVAASTFALAAAFGSATLVALHLGSRKGTRP